MSYINSFTGIEKKLFVGLLDCWTLFFVFFLSIRAFFSLSLFLDSGGAGDVNISNGVKWYRILRFVFSMIHHSE